MKCSPAKCACQLLPTPAAATWSTLCASAPHFLHHHQSYVYAYPQVFPLSPIRGITYPILLCGRLFSRGMWHRRLNNTSCPGPPEENKPLVANVTSVAPPVTVHDRPELIKIRRTGAKVWSDIAGALKAIRRSSKSRTLPFVCSMLSRY